MLNLIDTPGPRRLPLRSVAEPRRVRRRAPGRRRHAGRRGADARQRLPRARQRPRDHPGPQQDRPAVAPSPIEIAQRDRGRARPRRVERDPRVGARTGIGIDDDPRGDRRATSRRRRAIADAPLQRAHLRQLVRPLPRRRRPRPRVDGHGHARARRSASWRPGKDYEVHATRRARRREPSRSTSSAPGEVGFLVAAIKDVARRAVGDTVTDADRPGAGAAAGLQGRQADGLRRPLSRRTSPTTRTCATRSTSSSSTTRRSRYEPETSVALGFGFRCGFLGLLHMEIIQERLEREFNLDLITTAPSVVYRVSRRTAAGRRASTTRRSCRRPWQVERIEEPYHPRDRSTCRRSTSAPCMQLCQERRGEQKEHQVPRRDARHASPTRCRWPRSSSTSTTG